MLAAVNSSYITLLANGTPITIPVRYPGPGSGTRRLHSQPGRRAFDTPHMLSLQPSLPEPVASAHCHIAAGGLREAPARRLQQVSLTSSAGTYEIQLNITKCSNGQPVTDAQAQASLQDRLKIFQGTINLEQQASGSNT